MSGYELCVTELADCLLQIADCLTNPFRKHRPSHHKDIMLKKLLKKFSKTSSNTIDPIRRNLMYGKDSFTLTIHQGHGGTVVETEFYDYANDRAERSLYVISENQDLGEEISRILMMTRLKK